MIDEKILLSEISDLKKNMKSENGDYLSGYFSALSTIEGIIAGYPKIGEWILCKDKLPKLANLVIVSLKNESVGIGYIGFGDDEFYNAIPSPHNPKLIRKFPEHNPVIAWQPLPKAYKLLDEKESEHTKIGAFIPCEERLPKDMQDVLIKYKFMVEGGTHDGEERIGYGIGYLCKKKWTFSAVANNRIYNENIIAWMPLQEVEK